MMGAMDTFVPGQYVYWIMSLYTTSRWDGNGHYWRMGCQWSRICAIAGGNHHLSILRLYNKRTEIRIWHGESAWLLQQYWHCTVSTFSINTMTIVHLKLQSSQESGSHGRTMCGWLVSKWRHEYEFLGSLFSVSVLMCESISAGSCGDYVQWHGHLLSRSISSVHWIIV
jgi:hypothetical protein